MAERHARGGLDTGVNGLLEARSQGAGRAVRESAVPASLPGLQMAVLSLCLFTRIPSKPICFCVRMPPFCKDTGAFET